MTQTVQISSTPTFAWVDLLRVLERQCQRAAFVSGNADGATFDIDDPAPGQHVLAALDDLIAGSGLPLVSRRLEPDHFVVHPAAG